MENQTQHTPTPWHTEQASDGHFMIHETEGKSGVHEISLAHVKEERNAAFIVRAVNAHEELLATCQALISELRWTSKNGQFPGMDKVIAEADKAIAKAEGK